jgi:four helix bundle protein
MTDVRSFRDLDAWQVAMTLVEEVYAVTSRLPREEAFGLCSQLRRAAVSIPSNVAEGHQQGASRSHIRALTVALGSGAEVQTQLELLMRLGFVSKEGVLPIMRLASRTGQVLRGLQRSIKRRVKD